MAYINKNSALMQLQELVQNNISKKLEYMPESFNEQQQNTLKLFQKRIFLEKIIDETTAFNKSLNWDDSNKNLNLTTTAEKLIEVFKLRSEIFTEIGYQNEFPDTIEGLNFDKFDVNSAVLFYKNDKKVTGSLRCVFDSKDKLPSEEKFSFSTIRKNHNMIGELSRLVVKNEKKGLNLEFKNLFAGVYTLFTNNDIDLLLTGIKEEHYKLYSKFGGTKIIKNLNSYGKLKLSALILSWNPHEASRFFKKAFLQ